MPTKSEKLTPINEVIDAEQKEIDIRREKANLPEVKDQDGLVGVALSGGGLRSACFSLGIVQALHASNLWKRVDYLSSVSGGGYTAGFLTNFQTQTGDQATVFPLAPESAEDTAKRLNSSNGSNPCISQTTAKRPPVPKAGNATGSSQSGAQSSHVRKLIHSGNYLFRPAFFANRYLIGLCLINVAAFSLVIFTTAFTAFIWRCLDYEWVRQNADLLDLDDDLVMPFVPAAVFGFLWIIAWCVSLWRRNEQSSGAVARWLLCLFIPSLLIGMALVIGNGDNQGGQVQSITGNNSYIVSKSVWATLVGVVGAALLPWIKPQRILQSGINPQKPWERYVFMMASVALLIGVPLLLVGLFARENISGFNSHPYRMIVGGELSDPSLIASLITSKDIDGADEGEDTNEDNDTDGGESGTAIRPEIEPNANVERVRGAFNASLNALLPDDDRIDLRSGARRADKPLIPSELRAMLPAEKGNGEIETSIDVTRLLARFPFDDNNWHKRIAANMLHPPKDPDQLDDELEDTMAWVDALTASAKLDIDELFELREASDSGFFSFRDFEEVNADDRCRIVRALLCSATATRLIEEPASLARVRLKDDDRYHSTDLLPNIRQSYFIAGHWLGLDMENNASDHYRARRLRFEARRRLAQSTELAFFDDETLRRSLALWATSKATPDQGKGNGNPSETQNASAAPLDSAVTSYVDDLQADNEPRLTAGRGRQITRASLQAILPNAIIDRERVIRRNVTHSSDQWSRISIFSTALVVFLISGLLINLNTVSLHRYYRNRIANAFINSHTGSDTTPALSELATCQYGGPYHLITGAVTVWRNHVFQMKSTPVEYQQPETHKDGSKSLRWQDSFLMSKHFCGSELTGFVETKLYETRIPGTINKIDLADAIAISGAAVSPGNVKNPLIAALMVVLNLRLGQWLPNPRMRPKWFPNMAGRLMDLLRHWKNRRYYFVTDGGVNENLGLVQLLKRKCRLMICVDASHDPNHQFADFARAMSDVRVHDGIRFVEIEPSAKHSSALSLCELSPQPRDEDSLRTTSQRHFKVGKVVYCDKDRTEGLLVIIKPSLTGDESLDLLQYQAQNKHFPHQSTADQFYDPTQVEAYRRLGEHIGKRVARAIDASGKVDEKLSVAAISTALEKFELEQQAQSEGDSKHDLQGRMQTFIESKSWNPANICANHAKDLRAHFAKEEKQVPQALMAILMNEELDDDLRKVTGVLLQDFLPYSSKGSSKRNRRSRRNPGRGNSTK